MKLGITKLVNAMVNKTVRSRRTGKPVEILRIRKTKPIISIYIGKNIYSVEEFEMEFKIIEKKGK